MTTHDDTRAEILGWLDDERDTIIALLKAFLCAPSPNPPGNTLAASQVVCDYLEAAGLDYRVIARTPRCPTSSRPSRRAARGGIWF